MKIDKILSWDSYVSDFSHTFSNKILLYSYVYGFIIYAEKIKLAADVKRKENNGLMTVSYISILEQYFVCI